MFKHLIKSNNQIFTLSNNQLIDTLLANPTETDFLSQGFDSLNTLNSSLLSTLPSSEIEILTYTDVYTDTKVWLELSTQPFKPIDILNKAESFEVLTWTDESSIELQASCSLQAIDSGKLFSFELNDFDTIDNIEII